jgi:hypothetical protein
VLVPVHGATATSDGVTVGYARDLVEDSPDIDGDEISADTEQRLHAHYGVGHTASDVTPRRASAATTSIARPGWRTPTSGP